MAENQKMQLLFHRGVSIFLSILLLLISIDVFAQTMTTSTTTKLYRLPVSPGRIQIVSGGEAPISDDGVGLEANITVNNSPSVSEVERCDWKYFNPTGTLVINTSLFYFSDGADLGIPGFRDCFFLAGSNFADCHVTSFSQIIQLNTRCMELGTFRVDLEHFIGVGINGLGGTRAGIWSDVVNVVSTGPATQVQLSHTAISPEVNGGGGITSIPAGQTDVFVTVTDTFCPLIPLEGAVVTLSSKTVPGSGGHAHMGEQEGTGNFILGTQNGKIVSETTDLNGLVMATYAAGVAGLNENIEAVAEFGVNMSSTDQAFLVIAIQAAPANITLTPLPPSPDYIQVQSAQGKLNHPQNNFGTLDVINNRIPTIARLFRAQREMATGLTGLLSFNDLSLPLGGVFDLILQLNDAAGHLSHETGIDFDVNSKDSKLVPIKPEIGLLRGLAKMKGCKWVHFIHFRCNTAILK